MLLMLLLALTITAVRGVNGDAGEGMSFGDRMARELSRSLGRAVCNDYMPCVSFVRQQKQTAPWILQEQIDSLLPFYGYMTDEIEAEGDSETPSVREILLEEAREGTSGAMPEEAGEGISGTLLGEQEVSEEEASGMDTTLAELLRTENEAAMEMMRYDSSVFMPHVQQSQVDLDALKDYETLLRDFYTVDSNTMIGSDQLAVDKLLEQDMTVSKDSPGPQILIYHTHSQEAFADSVPGDASTSIVGIGERLTKILTETYGYSVLHHTAEYDVETRDDAYSKALPGVEQVLAENPSIQVIIDLHRDEMPEETRLVMDLDGRPTARFMFFNGLSRTKKTGEIAYLYNENLEGNLAFSFQMQKKAYEYYPGLTRKIYLKGYRYNMHLKAKYLLIELGAQNNTVEEAMNACDPLAHILDMVLSGQ